MSTFTATVGLDPSRANGGSRSSTTCCTLFARSRRTCCWPFNKWRIDAPRQKVADLAHRMCPDARRDLQVEAVSGSARWSTDKCLRYRSCSACPESPQEQVSRRLVYNPLRASFQGRAQNQSPACQHISSSHSTLITCLASVHDFLAEGYANPHDHLFFFLSLFFFRADESICLQVRMSARPGLKTRTDEIDLCLLPVRSSPLFPSSSSAAPSSSINWPHRRCGNRVWTLLFHNGLLTLPRYLSE